MKKISVIFLMCMLFLVGVMMLPSVKGNDVKGKISPIVFDLIEKDSDESVKLLLSVEKFDQIKLEKKLSKVNKKNEFFMEDINDSRKELVRLYQSKINQEIANDLENKIDIEVEYISEYLPYIIIYVNVNDISEIIKNKRVLYIELPTDFSKDVRLTPPGGGCTDLCFEDGDDTGDGETVTLEQFTEFDIYSTRAAYQVTGTNIKIGILEPGIFNPAHEYFNNDFEYVENVVGFDATSDYDQHALAVSLVIGGEHGVAPNAKLYGETLNDYVSDLDNLILQDVDVINMSFTFTYCTGTTYSTTYSSITDYVVSELGIPIVIAAGNNDSYDDCNDENDEPYNEPGDLFGYPQLSHNSIVVGSVQDNGAPIFVNSQSYNEPSGFDSKPTILAPGGGYGIDCVENTSDNTVTCSPTPIDFLFIPGSLYTNEETFGTSFAAPFVTGVIAMMMQKNSDLKGDPFAIAAIITASGDETLIDEHFEMEDDPYNGYHEMFGAGVINVEKIFEILVNQQYYSYEFITQSYFTTLPTFDITISSTSDVRVVNVHDYPQALTGYNTNFPEIEVSLEPPSGPDKYLPKNSNWQLLEFNATYTGIYIVTIEMRDYGDSIYTDKGAIAWYN